MTKSIEEQCKDYYESLPELESSEFTGETIFRIHQVAEAFIAGAKARDEQFLAVVNELREALKHTNEFCLCKRNTYGFDYHEDHPVMGKPKSGSRWLTPRDYNKDALTKADQMLKEMGINL